MCDEEEQVVFWLQKIETKRQEAGEVVFSPFFFAILDAFKAKGEDGHAIALEVAHRLIRQHTSKPWHNTLRIGKTVQRAEHPRIAISEILLSRDGFHTERKA